MKKLYFVLAFALVAFTAQAQLVDITFAVDMNGVAGFDPADGVFVAGDFQGWAPMDGALSDDDGDGIWTRTYTGQFVPTLSILYKFGIGNDWGNNEGGEMSALTDDCSVSDADGNINRTFLIPDENSVLAFVYDDCMAADFEPPVSEVAVTFAVNMNDVMDFDPAEGVFVAGEFQSWTPMDGALTDDDGNGVWSRTYMIAANSSVQYKFGRGNDWGNNEGIDDSAACAAGADGNRLLTTGTEDMVVNFMYNTCDESPLAVNVTELSTISDVKVFPNPMTNAATIQFTAQGGAAHDVIVSNLHGQVVREYANVRDNSLTIERQGMAAGMYFVTFRNELGQTGTIRLMVQ